MNNVIRVIECGGQGPRRVDVSDQNEIIYSYESAWHKDMAWFRDFASQDMIFGTRAIIYSVAGVVENHNKIIMCPNVHMLDGIKLSIGACPEFFCNDMEAAVTGMAYFFPNLDYFLGITRSTGIGAWVWKNGIVTNSETGHMKIDSSPFAPVCGCGHQGCAEAFFAGNALTRFAVGEMFLQNRQIPQGIHPCKWLNICYASGKPEDKWAVDYYDRIIIPAMAQFFANIQALLHLPAIVWKGALGLKSFKEIPDLENKIREEMKKRIINPGWVDTLKFYMANWPKDHDAYIGAAIIARNLLACC